MNKKNLGALLVSAAVALGMTGCAQPKVSMYIVESNFIENDDLTQNKEIIQTKEYKKVIDNIMSVAVQAPDSCKNETATTRTGDAESKDIVLKMNCGVEMGAIERSLARAGYEVITWNVLKSMVSKDGVTPKEAAASLGADALLQISSLERSRMLDSGNSRWDRRYMYLDRTKALVDANQERRLNHFAAKKEKQQSQTIGDRFSATLNANMTYVKSGRSIWFYQWTNNQKLNNSDLTFSTEVECYEASSQGPAYCTIPKGFEDEIEVTKLRSGSSYAISKKQNKKNMEQAIYNKLLRETVDDMVTSFKNKTTK